MKIEEIEKISSSPDWIYNTSLSDEVVLLLPKLIAVAKAADNFLDESLDTNTNMTTYLYTQLNLTRALEELELPYRSVKGN